MASWGVVISDEGNTWDEGEKTPQGVNLGEAALRVGGSTH